MCLRGSKDKEKKKGLVIDKIMVKRPDIRDILLASNTKIPPKEAILYQSAFHVLIGAATLGLFEVVFFASIALPLIRESVDDGLKDIGTHISVSVQGKPAVVTATIREEENIRLIFQNALALGIVGCIILLCISIALAIIMRRRGIDRTPPILTVLLTLPVMALFQLVFFFRMRASYREMQTPELIHTFFGESCST